MDLKYGYSFYPEHCFTWNEIERDIQLIKDSGANVVRMGEFCWDKLEPDEGVYDFEWLEKVIDTLGENGISTVLCTPTACPPIWLMNKYPDMRYVDNRGIKRPFGSRNHFCYNNADYRRLAAAIAEKLSEKFGSNPYVTGFQIGNEFAQEGTGRCHCDTCLGKFRDYLKDRYKTIDKLNKSWGTFFWSQTYRCFDEIEFPVSDDESSAQIHIRAFKDNPSLRLVFQRFCSDSMTDCLKNIYDALKLHSDKPVTTNSTGFGTNSVDYFDFYKDMDVYGLDSYPPLWRHTPSWLPLDYSFARALKQKNFWVLEFSIGGGHANQENGRPQPVPGAIELFSMYSFASGAQLLTHFQLKTFRFGAEQLNYSLLDQDSVPRRKYFEFQRTAAAVKKYEPLLTGTHITPADIAIVINYETLWAFRIKPAGSHRYMDYVTQLLSLLNAGGYTADVVGTEADLSQYKFVIVPSMFVTGEDFKEKISQYVNNGGYVLATFLTAVKDRNNVAFADSLPAGLSDVFGVAVSEVEPVTEETVNNVCISLDKDVFMCKNRYWLDELEPHDAQSLAVLTGGYRKNKCVLSKNIYGKGRAYYLATGLCEDTMKKLLMHIADKSGARRLPFELPQGVEAVVRSYGDGRRIYGLFNFSAENKILYPGEGYMDYDSGKISDEVVLEPKMYRFITEPTENRI